MPRVTGRTTVSTTHYDAAPSLEDVQQRGSLKRGMQGESVKWLQTKLGLAADGKFGAGTEQKLKAWQTENGLTADGKAGKQTLAKLAGGSTRPSGWTPTTGPSEVADRQPTSTSTPPKFFAFASPSDDPGHFNGTSRTANRAYGLSAAEVKDLTQRYGKNVLVGFDIGSLGENHAQMKAPLQKMASGDTAGIDNPALKEALKQKTRLHLYVGGPGGVTGTVWNEGEKKRTKEFARSVGITNMRDPSKANDPGTQDWREWGWKEHTFNQLTLAKQAGFETAEIDNLDSANHIKQSPSGTVAFFQEYAAKWQAGEIPKLVPKNLNEAQWRAVSAAVDRGDLPKGMFGAFAISEKFTGDRAEQARLARHLGIKVVNSNDTERYDAFAPYS